MKRIPAITALRHAILAILAIASVPQSSFAADKVLFDELKLNGVVVQNVRVLEANPIHVTVTFDGGSKTNIKRQDLPPELKALYPYDAREAAEHEKKLEADRERRAQEAKLRSEQATRELKTTLLREQMNIKARMAESEKELAELNKEIKVLVNKGRGRPKSPAHAEANRARDRKLAVQRRLSDQAALLEKVEKNLLLIP